MEAARTVTSARSGPVAGGWGHRLAAACLVLFPLLFLLLAGTGIHPEPSGQTAADQVRAVAASAGAWQAVHLALAAAALLGMGAVLALRGLVPDDRSRRPVAASILTALGVAAAGLVAGIVVTEAALVAPVAEACAAGGGSCLSAGNEPFLGEFAGRAWNDLPHLSYAAGTLLFSLAGLTVLGWRAGTVRPWEASALLIGIVGIYATNTVLHGDARYGLGLMLVAGASIAYRQEGDVIVDDAREEARRWVRRRHRFLTIVGIYLALSLLWFAIDMLTGTDDLWFYWPVLGAGVIVAVVGIAMLGLDGLFGVDWERRQVDRYLQRRGTGADNGEGPAGQ